MPSNQLPEDVRAEARKVAHLAVENALVEMRDSRISIMPWANATASAFNMQDVARMAGLPTPETTGGE